jgi:glycine hydroxymethyltransferase
MALEKIRKTDPKIARIIEREKKFQEMSLNLIASENYPSLAVRQALSSFLVSRYSEGHPGERYYGGMKNIDELELLVEERVKKIFLKDQKNWAVNVQPYSGSPANYAVLRGLLNPGEKLMSLALAHGGHLSQGAAVSLAGQDFKVIHYFLDRKNQTLDYQTIKTLARKKKPKLIITGYSAYPRKIDFKKFREIADAVKAYLLADISHIAGLVAAGFHPSPFPWADVVVTTTHKTLRGPRGAIIICRRELKDKIFPKVFPGLQGGPHNHTIAAIGIALKEVQGPQFKKYTRQIIVNARVLAEELKKYGFNLVSGGTDTHLILIDLTPKKIWGRKAQDLLEEAGIIVNKNPIPYDLRSIRDPSGIRLGTPAVTCRGMKEKEMKKIALWINLVISRSRPSREIKKEVQKLCRKFPLL